MVPILPASTVMILRENVGIIEVLLLKRNSTLAFAPDVWVFPGGRIDQVDGRMDQDAILSTAKVAGVRECKEETSLEISPSTLHHFCKWTTPTGGKKRFETFFFHCLFDKTTQKVKVDNSEIIDHIWITPKEALQKIFTRELNLLPPTFITLERIKDCKTYSEVLFEFERTGVIIAEPVTTFQDGKFYSLYKGDSGYHTGDIKEGDSLHRLTIEMSTGKYQVAHQNTSFPPVHGGVKLLT